MRKHKVIFSVCFVFMIIFNTLPIFAINISKISDTKLLDASYGFTPHFISGITEVETFGMTNYKEDQWDQIGVEDWSISKKECVRISSNDQKGKVGVMYRNVGQYKGEIVDLKITVKDWDCVRDPGTKDGKGTYPTIAFFKDDIIVQPQSVAFKGLKYSFEFYHHNSLEPFSLKFHNTFKDMDVTEYMILNDGQGLSDVHLTDNTYLKIDGNKIFSPDAVESDSNNKEHWITVLGETAAFDFEYSRKRDEDFDMLTPLNTRTFYWFIFSGESVSRFDTPPLNEKVDDSEMNIVLNTTEFNYKTYFTVPQESFYYTKFELRNEIEDCLQVEGVKVFDESGTDVTSLFNIDQNVDLRLKDCNDPSFYGKSYIYQLIVKKKKAADVSMWSNKVPNHTTITTDRGIEKSNIVYTTFKHTITSSIQNGNITQSQKDINATESRTFEYTSSDTNKYVLESVCVDDKLIDIKKYPTSYTFNNINDDHKISVKYKRVYAINTFYKGEGNITESINNIELGDSKTIAYESKNGYYLRRLIIDEKEVDLERFPKEYKFDNINDDHKITAEFLKQPKLTINEKIDLNTVQFDLGNPTFIFKIEGDDFLGNHHVLHRILNFDEIDLVNVRFSKQIVIDDLLAGTYDVKLLSTIRYGKVEIVQLDSGTNNFNASVTLNTDGQDSSVTFLNKATKYQNYSHNDFFVASFNK